MTRAQERLQQVRLMLALERVLQPKTQRQLTREVKQMAELVATSTTPTVTLLDQVSDLSTTFQPAWVKLLSKHYQQTGAVFGQRIFTKFVRKEKKGFRDTFRLSMERFIQKWGLNKARAIVKTTRDTVRAQIVIGIAEGLGTREIAKAIRDQITGIGQLNPQQRSLVIARTETHTAANYAGDAGVRVLDLPETRREWLAVEDERTRITHSEADGQQVGMDEPFIVGGVHLMFPGDPDGPPEETINCRCVVTYEVIERGE